MTSEDLMRLHSALVYITKEIDRVCRDNGIKYSLIGGSLLGSVRHRGFIPWDDDMDIAMLRDDFERFVSACEAGGLKPEFDLQTNTNDKGYVYGHAKVLLKGTSLVQFGHERTSYRKGIFVDIFPFDSIPNSWVLCQTHKYRDYLCKKLLRQKLNIANDPSWGVKEKIVYRCISVISKLFSKDFLVRILNKNMVRYRGSLSEKITNLCGYYGYEKETVPRRLFDSVEECEFEGAVFFRISAYDEYLNHIYGNYMQLPPEEKRRTHGFQKLDFGTFRVDKKMA